ncbi:MAG: hypothetical protein LBP61_08280, partial [Desulfovibrio sp.]|nr:hypothetical protein [Desulfovibrio sp.]
MPAIGIEFPGSHCFGGDSVPVGGDMRPVGVSPSLVHAVVHLDHSFALFANSTCAVAGVMKISPWMSLEGEAGGRFVISRARYVGGEIGGEAESWGILFRQISAMVNMNGYAFARAGHRLEIHYPAALSGDSFARSVPRLKIQPPLVLGGAAFTTGGLCLEIHPLASPSGESGIRSRPHSEYHRSVSLAGEAASLGVPCLAIQYYPASLTGEAVAGAIWAKLFPVRAEPAGEAEVFGVGDIMLHIGAGAFGDAELYGALLWQRSLSLLP